MRIWLTMGLGVLILIGSGLVASMAQAQPAGDPAAVISAYEMARNRRDVDAALSYFADDATVTQRSTVYSGKDEIRKFLEGLTGRSRFVVVSDRNVDGTHVTWSERSGSQAQGPPPQTFTPGGMGGSTGRGGFNPNTFVVSADAVVQDGKIRSLSYLAGSLGQAGFDPALEGRAQLPATAGLAAVFAVLIGGLMLASITLGRAKGTSTLRGRLLHGLQGWTAARQ